MDWQSIIFYGILAIALAMSVAWWSASGRADDAEKRASDYQRRALSIPGTIALSEGKNGRWRWSLRGTDGEFLCSGHPNGFPSEADARDNARSIFINERAA